MEKILARLSPKPQLPGIRQSVNQNILTKLSEQQALLEKQKDLLASNNAVPATSMEVDKLYRASPFASVADSLPVSGTVNDSQFDVEGTEASELHRLKQELFAANSRIALQEQELAQTRVIKHTLDQALGPPSEADFGGRDISEQTISHLQNAFNASNRSLNQPHDAWSGQEDSQSDISDALSAGAYNKARGFWVPPTQQVFGMSMNAPTTEKGYGEAMSLPSSSVAGHDSSKFWNTATTNSFTSHGPFHPHRVLSGPSSGTCGFDTRFSGEQARYLQAPGLGPRRSITQVNRGGSCFPTQNSPWGTFAPGPSTNPTPRSPANRPCSTYQQVGLYPIPPYHPRPAGTPLSPTATEFTSSWSNSSVSSPLVQFILHILTVSIGGWKFHPDVRFTP